MRSARNTNPLPRLTKEECRRQHGRVLCEMVMCSLGEVLDACAAGLRVRAPKAFEFENGDIVAFTIAGEDRPLEFKGRVMWTKRKGIGKYEMGLQFVELSQENREALVQLARGAVFNTTFFTSFAQKRRVI